ncbi:MAG TPA: hypothetical protein VGD14_01175, partial [bacterium]
MIHLKYKKINCFQPLNLNDEPGNLSSYINDKIKLTEKTVLSVKKNLLDRDKTCGEKMRKVYFDHSATTSVD